MDFIELAKKRRSCRRFETKPIPDDIVMEIFAAAAEAPSAGNSQPWHFYAVKDREVIKKLCEACHNQRQVREAPVVFAVCADLDISGNRYGERGRTLYAYQDTAAAIQNMLLAAADRGIGTCWCGAFDEESAAKILAAGGHRRVVAIIPAGYIPADYNQTAGAKIGRRNFKEIYTLIGFDEETKK